MQEFTLALMQAVLPYVTIWVLAKYFLLQGKTNTELIRNLTRQVLSTKNPWAAQQELHAMAGETKAEAQLKDMVSKDPMLDLMVPEEDEDTV